MMEPALRITTDADRVMTITLDLPGKPVNTCAPQLLDELATTLDAIERDPPAGVIFASAKARSFNAGADLTAVQAMSPSELADYLARGQSLFERIARLPVPTVAAINGDCLGGGFEMALACSRRVAADDTSISIGLPEVKLGLIPAWGGTTRLPRLIGLRRALPILLAGKTMPPRKALKSGLIDEVVRADALPAAASRLVRDHSERRSPRLADRAIGRFGSVRRHVLDAARRQTEEKTFGNYPAPMRLLEVIETGYAHGFEAGLRAEREAIFELAQGPVARNLLRIFFLRQGAKKRLARQISAPPHEVHHAAVIGGGTMGAGIIHSLIRAGVQVRLVEVSASAVSAALQRVKKLLDDDVASGKLDKLAARKAMYHVSPTTGWGGLRLADLVVEAAFESIEVKRDVFRCLEQHCRPDAVLATNTSSLRVGEIAESVADRSRVIGLHFFNPVPKMPLVEIVRTPSSSDEALATAVAVAAALGKIAILVADAPGFLVNRLLIPYLSEALRLAQEGTSIAGIDRAMKRWGMPMGPFELLDEIGLDVGSSVLASVQRAGDAPATPQAVQTAIERKWLGRKTNCGFYLYQPTGKRSRKDHKPEVNAQLAVMLHPGAAAPADNGDSQTDESAIQWRLVLPMVNQAAGALREGVVDAADTIDLATVMGAGLAPFRGGLTRFADDVGLARIVVEMEALAAKYPDRYTPDPLLREMADRGARFADWKPAAPDAPPSDAPPTDAPPTDANDAGSVHAGPPADVSAAATHSPRA